MKTSSPRTAVMKEEMTHTQSVDQAVNMFMSAVKVCGDGLTAASVGPQRNCRFGTSCVPVMMLLIKRSTAPLVTPVHEAGLEG